MYCKMFDKCPKENMESIVLIKLLFNSEMFYQHAVVALNLTLEGMW